MRTCVTELAVVEDGGTVVVVKLAGTDAFEADVVGGAVCTVAKEAGIVGWAPAILKPLHH